MITLLNYIGGVLIRILSKIIIRFNTPLRIQLEIIKNRIESVNKQEENITEYLLISIIKIEDKRFYNHYGIDLYSIIRAFAKNITGEHLEGASTIVQQLVRNITDEREIRLRRKFKEIIFSTLINKEFTKNELLFAYLTTYKFNMCIGIFDFCKTENYDIKSLSFNESAQIAARLKYPSITINNYTKYLMRVRIIEMKTVLNYNNGNNYFLRCFLRISNIYSTRRRLVVPTQ